ncbi:hypothetical protein C5748_03835 [Phyllobacterium phragmitis]|uniref:Bacteriophage tail tape measure N-terminal domain-containing protein n=1 Tax=Phyllobacterium phragmitis TaxID=2670329 RepID=A0A2S9IXS2_9HYPH|nr:phage tail length tape measure family protein [Phyllobacterium phragmitis]PRD45336.1 hypothetical protein C5748_03835 [Phyllobacterium phragmitis]
MTSPMRLSMIITGDASGLKSATSSAKADVANLNSTVAQSSATMKGLAASNDQAAASSRRATEAARGQALAENELRSKVSGFLGIRSGMTDSSMVERQRELQAYGRELDQVRAQYKPLMDAQQRHLSLLAELNAAEKIGAITEEQRVASIAKAQAAYSAQVAAIQSGGAVAAKSTALASHEVTNLSYQLNDIVVMLASGQSPFLLMMQQGGQVAQIMGNRGLGEIFPALLVGMKSLITPTTLLMVGFTAVGYAASYALDGMFTKTRKVSEITSEHEEQVRKLRDAYQYAGTGADEYYRRAMAGSRIAAAATRQELDKAIQRSSQAVASEAYVQNYGADVWVVDTSYNAFAEALEHLRMTAKEGQPDILGFRKMVEDRWSLEPNNEKLLKTGLALLGVAKNGLEAAESLDKTSPAAIRAANAVEAAARRMDHYKEALSGLREIAAPELSDRRQVENQYATARGNAGDGNERSDADRQRAEALARITAQEQRQIELARVDIQLQAARNPLTRAELTAQRERIQLSGMEIDAAEAENRVRQARNQVMAEAMAQSSAQILDMRAEAAARAKVNDAIAAGTVSAADAEQYLRAESELRPLITAAARAEGDEKQRLLSIISQTVEGYQALAKEERRASAEEYIRSQRDRIELMRAELSVVSAGEAERERMLDQLETEQEIRRRGLDVGSAEANMMRQNTKVSSELRAEIEKQRDAWTSVRSTGEDAIDGIFDALGNGDYKDALKSIALDITRTFTDLAVKNPLKNSLLGTSYGTLDDLFKDNAAGGLLSALTGGKSVGAMNVTAATVMINGGVTGGLASFLGGSAPAANTNITSVMNNAVQSVTKATDQALNFVGNYKSGVDARLTDILNTAASSFPGLKIDAISGLRPGDSRFHGQGLATDVQLTELLSGKMLGNYQDASSFRTYEQFAQTARGVQMAKYPELADQFRWGGYFSGGKGQYGALDTMHFDLGGRQAGMAGGSWAGGLTSGQRSLWPGVDSQGMDTASAALEKLGSSAGATSGSLSGFGSGLGTAGKGLDQLGSGFNSFGKQLSSFAAGGSGGGLGILSALFPNAGSFSSGQLAGAIASGSMGLWDSGGWTGPGGKYDVAGIVHRGEVVFSQEDVARHGGAAAVDAIRLGRRGYASGGVVSDSGPSPIARLNSAANSNPAQGSSGRNTANFNINLEGARGNKEIEESAYLGMQRALEEYDMQLPDRVQEISEKPRWRG